MSRKKILDCQTEYNYYYNKVRSSYTDTLRYASDWEQTCQALCQLDSIPGFLKKKYSDGVINQIEMNDADIFDVFCRLLTNQQTLFQNTLSVAVLKDELLEPLVNMLRTATAAPDMSKYGHPEIYSRIRETVFRGFAAAADKLEQTARAAVDGCVANMQGAVSAIKELYGCRTVLPAGNDSRYAETYAYHDRVIAELFDGVISRINGAFYGASKLLLTDSSSYQSILARISAVIGAAELFVCEFREFPLRPADISRLILYMKSVADRFRALEAQLRSEDICYMIENDIDTQYGVCSQQFSEYAVSLLPNEIDRSIKEYYGAVDRGDYEIILKITLQIAAAFLWHYAMQKPYSEESFSRAADLYASVSRGVNTAEIHLARLYCFKQIGNEKATGDYISNLLDPSKGLLRELERYAVRINRFGSNSEALVKELTDAGIPNAETLVSSRNTQIAASCDYNTANKLVRAINNTDSAASAVLLTKNSSDLLHQMLTTLASGLKWMKETEGERKILQYMLSSGIQMSVFLQKRLSKKTDALVNAPQKHLVPRDAQSFPVDIATYTWHENQFKQFFEQLDYNNDILDYPICVRAENKDLLLTNGVPNPAMDMVMHRLGQLFDVENNKTVTVKGVHGKALSDGSVADMPAILITPVDLKCFGILVSSACIGRNLNLCMYSLYIPARISAEEQMADALGLYNKTNPLVTMWENGIRSAVLLAYQELLSEKNSYEPAFIEENNVLL